MQRLTQSTSCFQFSVSAKEMEKLSYSLHITAAESTNQNVVRISVFLVVFFFSDHAETTGTKMEDPQSGYLSSAG